MSILENELVKKYFGCPKMHSNLAECIDCLRVPGRILKAMEEPIQAGERILVVAKESSSLFEYEYPVDVPAKFHPSWIRLPDQFQQILEKCECVTVCVGHDHSKCACRCECHKKPDPVEDAIRQIVAPFVRGGPEIEKKLRELVELVRKEK